MNPRLSIIAAAVRRVVQGGGGGGVTSDPYINNVVFLSHFNGTHLSTTIADDCGSTVTSVNNSRLTDARKKFGVTNLECGPGQHLVVPHRTELNLLASDLTIEMWIYPQGAWYQVKSLLTKYVNQNAGFLFQVSAAGLLTFTVAAGSYYSVISASAIPVDQWVHVAVTLKNKTARLFVNGVMDRSADFSGYTLTDSSSAMYIGFDPLGSARYFYGNIDEMRITRGVARYTSNFTVPTDEFPSPPTDAYYDPYWGYVTSALKMEITNPTGGDPYWSNTVLLMHLDGTNGSAVFTDEKGHTMIASGSASLSTTSPKFGTASLTLDGVGDWVQTTTSPTDFVFGTGDFTIEAWVKTSDTDAAIIDFYMVSDSGWQVYLTQTGALSFYTSALVLTGTTQINTGQWVHVAVSRASGTLFLFVNGNLDGSTTLATDLNYNSGVLSLGAQVASRNPSYDYIGLIDEVRITKGVARYTSSFTVPSSAFPGVMTSTSVSDLKGNAVTVAGATLLSEANKKYGTASAYLGGSGGMTVTDGAVMNFGTGDFTVEAWVYQPSQTDRGPLFYVNGPVPFGLDCGSYGRYPTFYSASGNNFTGVITLPATPSWVHVAVVRSGATMMIFINGQLSGQTSLAWASGTMGSATGSSLTIGKSANDLSIFTGYIDDFRVTKGVARYTAAFTPETSSFAVGRVDPLYSQVASLLRFNGDSGASVITDEAGMVWTAVSGTITTETDIKKYGLSAGKFTNTVRYVTGSVINIGTTQDFCVEFWVYLEQGSAYQATFDINNTTYIYISTANKVVFNCSSASYVTPSAINLNQWYHLAMFRSGTSVKFAIDGVVVSSVTSSVSYVNSVLTLGYNVSVTGGSTGLRGRMDNFRLTIGSPRYTTTPFTPTDCGYLS